MSVVRRIHPKPMTRPRVLVVEDNRDIRESIVELLENHGYVAWAASDGVEALAKLEAQPAPCVILLDLMMPNMDGRGFRAEQLRRPELSSIPVVLISAHTGLAESARELGAAAHLEKPLKVSRLLETIRVYCGAAG